MVIIYVICIKDIVSSSELLDSENARYFFDDEISSLIVNYILIDFTGVELMNQSFALQYLTSKQYMNEKKTIREINLPENIYKTLQRAQKKMNKSKTRTEDKKKKLGTTANPLSISNL